MRKKRHPIYERKLRMGMVGGGPGAFIGEVHRKAARMDGQIDLVAGAFSRDPEKSKQVGREQYIDPARTYGTWKEMIKNELMLPPERRIDFVCIVTPNDSHYPISGEFLKARFHVVLDKPMTINVREAKALQQLVTKSRKVFALTHSYTGYPMVKLARDMIRQGDLGKLRKIRVEYSQGWLHAPIEKSGVKQAIWRTDPKQSGAAGCMGDIGTHAENLAEYITGLRIVRVCADLNTIVTGRKLDDDGNCLIHWEKDVKGMLSASQICVGEENDFSIRVYGDQAAIEWRQENPNYLHVKKPDAPLEVWRRGNSYVGRKSPAAERATRIPFGHPEGFIEAFANIYINVAETIRACESGAKPDPLALDFPTVADGLRGMQFIETIVKSAKLGGKWVKFPK